MNNQVAIPTNMAAAEKEASKPKGSTRDVGMDILRSIAMFMVVMVHTSSYLEPVSGKLMTIMVITALLCDPVFFMLSGYFAIRPSKRSLGSYYIRKFSTILIPVIVYSILLYLISNKLQGLSLGGYLQYFNAKMVFTEASNGPWWFIPTLIPCLIAAPFIQKGFEALSDKQVFTLGAIMCGLFMWGMLFSGLQQVFAIMHVETLSEFSALCLKIVPPSLLAIEPSYLQFFIMGGIFRRLQPRMTDKIFRKVVILAAICYAFDVLLGLLGISRNDPDYFWMLETIGIMAVFTRVKAASKTASSVSLWIAKRSYTIYLVHTTLLPVVASAIYVHAIFGPLATMSFGFQLLAWILLVVGTYFSALIFASICDPLILSNVQKGFMALARKLGKDKNSSRSKETVSR